MEKRNIVHNDADRIRFIHDLYAFNDTHGVDPNHRFREFGSQRPRKPLVRIHAFCLMTNHYHLLVEEIEDAGISLFMRKLNMGYAKYFNERYSRTGVLWQGIFKKILIEHDAHFLHVPFYIHLNPLDAKFPEWREGKVTNTSKAFEYLMTYRWSSYLDYSGKRNFPSLLFTELLNEILGTPDAQKRAMIEMISNNRAKKLSARLE